MTVTLALVYPPACDPTAPYLAVPTLTAFMRANGITVLPIDANAEGFDHILSKPALAELHVRLEASLTELDARTVLDHSAQLRYAAQVAARGDAAAVAEGIEEAKAILRDPQRFYDSQAYDSAVRTIDAALRVVSAAHHPLHLDFTAYRTPFGLLSQEEILRAATPEMDPFDDYVAKVLIPKLRDSGAKVIGVSVCFPGQLQPAYAFAWKIKQALPDVHVVGGGPGLTQLMIRLSGHALAEALGPFDSAVVFEGENTLLKLVQALQTNGSLRKIENLVIRDSLQGARYLSGHGMEDLKPLPAPDFDGLSLAQYFAPALTIPYDPTRGCYWGKCTFCHYGLAEVGTASYREREVVTMVDHLRELKAKYNTKHFYFSQDSVAPKTLLKLAEGLIEAKLDLRWGTDLKPEKYLTLERAARLRAAGAVACALGVESGSDRILRLIDKGAPSQVVSDVIDRLAASGVAPEAMCFTDFPTETKAEALETLDFIREREDRLATYIVGEFGLTHGALVAQEPHKFGIREVFQLGGDRLGLSLFFTPEVPWKTDDERAEVNDELQSLSAAWALRPYPWAGAVSTAHTLMYYAQFGPGAFRDEARKAEGDVLGAAPFEAELVFNPAAADAAQEREAQIWATLVYEQRHVSRAAYEALSAQQPELAREPGTYAFAAEAPPIRVKGRVRGRRPSHAHSSARG